MLLEASQLSLTSSRLCDQVAAERHNASHVTVRIKVRHMTFVDIISFIS
jgi:hypothetical protein